MIDDIPADARLSSQLLTSVGLSSVPDWLKPYDVLSNGQKMRASLAYALSIDKDIIVFDEFTSVVDREVAKVTSLAVSKSVRRTEKKFVAVTCHYDVIDYLQPDWVFDTEKKTLFAQAKSQQSILESTKQKVLGQCLVSITI